MIERMRFIAGQEGIVIEDAALAALAYRADGGLRDALTMLEQVAAFADGAVSVQTVDAAFGASGHEYARTLLEAIANGASDAVRILATIADANDAGIDMQTLIRSLGTSLRHVLVGALSPPLLASDLSAADAATFAELGTRISQARVVQALGLLNEALAAARASGVPRLELETALLRFVFTDADAQQPAAPTQRPVPVRTAVAERPTAPAPSAPAAANGPLSLQKVRASWEAIKTRVYERKVSLRAPLGRANVAALEGDALTLTLGDDIQGGILRDNVALIETCVEEVLGRALRVGVKIEGAPRGEARSAAAGPATVSAGENEDLALIQYAMKRLGGTP